MKVAWSGFQDKWPAAWDALSAFQIETSAQEAMMKAIEPELWFLDEPFLALDPRIRAQMQDEFLRIPHKGVSRLRDNARKKREFSLPVLTTRSGCHILTSIRPDASGGD